MLDLLINNNFVIDYFAFQIIGQRLQFKQKKYGKEHN